MTYIIIAIVILLVGAAAEITAYVFTDKLLKKKEDGLDRRKAALDAAASVIFAKETRKLVRICAEANISASSLRTSYSTPEKMMAVTADEARHKLCSNLFLHIPVVRTENADGSLTFRAELWVAEGGPDGVS